MDEWIFIGGNRTSAFSDSKLSKHELHSIQLLNHNLQHYGIDMDDILALGLSCFHCSIARDRKFLYYMFNEATRGLRVFGTACAKSILGIRKKCRSCGELYDYLLNSCDKCDNKPIKFGGNKFTYRHVADNYRDFCYSQIYGNQNSKFSQYLFSNGFYEKPNISYQYYTEKEYKNSSIYHVYLFNKRTPCNGPIPEEDIEWLKYKLTHKCFVCENNFMGVSSFIIRTLEEKLHVCYVCQEKHYTIWGTDYLLKGILSLDYKALVGYFYANDDEISDIIGKRFRLIRDIDISENPDIIDYRNSKIDKVKFLTCELFRYEFDNYSREFIRGIFDAKCDICGFSTKLKSHSELLSICNCDNALIIKIYDVVLFDGTFRELLNNETLCKILVSSNNSDSIIGKRLETKYEAKIFDGDIVIESNHGLSIGILPVIEYDISLLFKLLADPCIERWLQFVLETKLFTYRVVVRKMLSMIGIGTTIKNIIALIGKRKIRKPFKTVQFSTACNPKKPSQVHDAFRANNKEIFTLNPGLLEYYAFINNLDEIPIC